MSPLLSIIMPLYNRAHLVGRALDSCLRQPFTDWEAIVVDDGSTDESVKAVEKYTDPRITLVRLAENQGQCVARNSGAARASGEWLIFLDSDDELADNSLTVVAARANEAAPHIGRLFFGCQWDDGTISPDPPFDGREMNYEGFVRWLERMHNRPTETISVARRSAFLEVPYPNRRAYEGGHNLNFVRRFAFVGYPDIVRLYHLDAHNRMTNELHQVQSLLDIADRITWMSDDVLANHGDALRRWSPTTYHNYLRSSGVFHLLSGNRAFGMSRAWQAWLTQPWNLKAAALLGCSWLPPRALARVKARWSA